MLVPKNVFQNVFSDPDQNAFNVWYSRNFVSKDIV